MSAVKSFELDEQEVAILKTALDERVDNLRNYKTYLKDGEGNNLAGAYTAIGQVDQELYSTLELFMKLYFGETE
jgi:hypothetical protein